MAAMLRWFMVIGLAWWLGQASGRVTETGRCRSGEYLRREWSGGRVVNTCLPCPGGTFSPVDDHQNFDCAHCSVAHEILHEIVLTACTPVSDAEIGCEPGFFRHNYRFPYDFRVYGECYRCSSCAVKGMNTIQPCGPFTDTVCSSEQLTCHSGQYLNRNADGQEICLPCPVDSFQSEDGHRNADCGPCSNAQPDSHEIVLQQCTPTSDTVIGCEVGYYRQNFSVGGRDYGECNRCSRCDLLNMFQAAPCQPFRNTQCSTQEIPFTCNKGQYVTKDEAGQNICLPCPAGTFQPHDNHSYMDCAECTTADTILREVVHQACNSTSDTVIACQAGYYRLNYHPPIPLRASGSCERCRPCQGHNRFVLRPCDFFKDTVCGPLEEVLRAGR